MLEKSETAEKLRLPRPFNGVNVNFCRNPLCSNTRWPASSCRSVAASQDSSVLRSIPDARPGSGNLYGYYSPAMVEKMLTIFRTYFNFIAKGEDGKTPAMRLGLAKGPVRFEDIIYLP
mgnify:CR=1 FL=1